jgi:DtxR family transcriptional regulator, Mn-dependent transcriptional regulator
MIERHSETEENYLKAIFKYSKGGEMVSTNTIAKDLGTTAASVTDMLKRLSEKQMVEYIPYRGARLTASAEKVALGIIRKHRLWELFLVKVLNFSWDRVHDTAEQLEHVNSPELVEKLDEFLGFPQFDPHGDPIPSKDGVMAMRETCPLPALEVGVEVTMAGVLEHSPEFLQYLDRLGMNIGARITILEKIGFDQSLLLRVQEREIVLSGEFAKQILALP